MATIIPLHACNDDTETKQGDLEIQKNQYVMLMLHHIICKYDILNPVTNESLVAAESEFITCSLDYKHVTSLGS